MEEAILELELLKLEKEKAENPTMNLSKRREPILKQFIAAIRKNDERDNLLLEEIVSLKAKNVELTGKSLSEALLFSEHGENMLCTKIVLNVRNNFCTQHVLPRFELGIFMY